MNTKDYLGNQIQIGDTIIYGTKSGSRVRFKVAIVEDIYEAEDSSYAYAFGRYQPVKRQVAKLFVRVGDDDYSKVVTLSNLNTVVVVNPARDSILREHLNEYGKYVFDHESGK